MNYSQTCLKICIILSSTCRNSEVRLSRVTCAGESPDDTQRKDQLHHDEQVSAGVSFPGW